MNNKNFPNETQLNKVFDPVIFKVVSEPVRTEIIRFLASRGACDISSIAAHFNKDRSVISKHLKIMYESGFLIKQKQGRHTFYHLDGMALLFRFENIVDNIKTILQTSCADNYTELHDKRKTFGEFVKENDINLIEDINK